MSFFLPFLITTASSNPLVIDFQDGMTKEEIQKSFQIDVDWIHPNSEDESLAYPIQSLSESQKQNLIQSPLVEAIEESIRYEAFSTPNDPLFSRQWNLEQIGAQNGWEYGSGRGITVAVIDTGVAPVQDLNSDNILEGISFVRGESSSIDLNGHGTHVAGTIAQYTNNKYGAAGIAPEATILPIKVLSKQGFGQSEWIASGIDEAVDRGAAVINLSLGGSSSKVIQVAVNKALKKGVIVIAAAGNTGKKGVSSPASIQGVLAISATGPSEELAPYSSWGKEIFISAPGGDKSKPNGGILQETISGNKTDFLEFQGTSMATPHVSGAVAVLLGAGAQPSEIANILKDSAKELGKKGRDEQFGHGRLDLKKALELLPGTSISVPFSATASFAIALIAGFRFRVLFTIAGTLLMSGAFFFPWLGIESSPALRSPLSIGIDIPWFSGIWTSVIPALGIAILTLGYDSIRWLGALCAISWTIFLIQQTGYWSIFNGLLCAGIALLIAGIHRNELNKNR